MNAIVEVATIELVADAEVVKVSTSDYLLVEVMTEVATSTLRVPSISGHSISAVAPDYNFEGGLAMA